MRSTEPDVISAVSRLVEGGFRDYETFHAPCSCAGEVARTESFQQVDGSAEGQRWLEDLQLAHKKHDVAAEREILRLRYRRVTSLERTQPQFGRVTEDCEICAGRDEGPSTFPANAEFREPEDIPEEERIAHLNEHEQHEGSSSGTAGIWRWQLTATHEAEPSNHMN